MNNTTQIIKTQKQKVGRPTVFSEQIIAVLIDCFRKGLSDKTACEEAKIGRTAFYEKLKTDEEFSNTIARAKNKLALKAAEVVSKALEENDVKTARWILERKERAEFSLNPPSVLINQNFTYKPPSWFMPPKQIIDMKNRQVNQKPNKNLLITY